MQPVAASPAPIISHGSRSRPHIALTFDDNFHAARGLAIIEVLRRYQAPATMFVVGDYVHRSYDLDRALAEGGFEIGDHTASHPYLPSLSWTRMLAEIGAGTAAFQELTGAKTSLLFRPPYGAANATVAAAAAEKGFRFVVLWDVDTNDWKGLSARTMRDHVLRRARNGSIILMHLSARHTAEALPSIIQGLRDRGFQLVTVSELLKNGRLFLDVDHTTESGRAVSWLVERAIMSGYDEFYFGPADPMTRAQIAKVAVLSAGIHTPEVERTASPSFLDVLPEPDPQGSYRAYPFDFVEEAAAAGLVLGREGDAGPHFNPWASITRGQLAQIVARMARELKGYPPLTSDDPPFAFGDVSDYARDDIELLTTLGLMKGYPGGRFDPWSHARRDHVAAVMTRFLDLPPTEGPPPSVTTTEPPTTTSPTTTTQPPGPLPAGPRTFRARRPSPHPGALVSRPKEPRSTRATLIST